MHSTPMGSDNSIALAAVPAAVRQARSFATETLKGWGLPPDAIDTIVLLVSELAANALPRPKTSITHMDEPETFAQFSVQLACHSSGIRIYVRDSNPEVPEKKCVTDEDESGRGLLLVETLSRSWGYFIHRGLKTVWAEVDCAASLRSADQPLHSKPILRRPVALDSRRRRQVTVPSRPARSPR